MKKDERLLFYKAMLKGLKQRKRLVWKKIIKASIEDLIKVIFVSMTVQGLFLILGINIDKSNISYQDFIYYFCICFIFGSNTTLLFRYLSIASENPILDFIDHLFGVIVVSALFSLECWICEEVLNL